MRAKAAIDGGAVSENHDQGVFRGAAGGGRV